MQLQANNKKVWQAARTGNSPAKLVTLRQKDRQITVHSLAFTKWCHQANVR